MLNYVTITLTAAVLALAGAFYWQTTRLGKVVAEKQQIAQALQTAQDGLKRQRVLSARLAKEKAATAAAGASLRQELDSALARQQDWAQQPVPQEVQDALND